MILVNTAKLLQLTGPVTVREELGTIHSEADKMVEYDEIVG